MGKIVQLSSVHHSKDTRIFYKICKSLVNNGYDLDLIIQHSKNETIEGVNIIALPKAKKKFDRFTKVIPFLLVKTLKYKRGTIFHFHDPELIIIGFILKILGHKVIYDVHEDVPKTILEKDWVWRPLRKTLSYVTGKIEKIGNIFFDATIVVTQSISHRFEKRTILIQNFPVLETNHTPSIRSEKKENGVFYIGSISKVRGIEEMLKAVELINDRKELKLTLAGTFSDHQLQEQVKNTEGWKYVNYLGRINREELKSYAESSVLGLVIFYPIPNHIEAQPNKLFEYMQFGLPLIGSNFDLWKEIVEKNNCGILVDPLNPTEIAEAIEWIISHPEEAKKMGENGRKAVNEKYNWKMEEMKLFALYKELNLE